MNMLHLQEGEMLLKSLVNIEEKKCSYEIIGINAGEGGEHKRTKQNSQNKFYEKIEKTISMKVSFGMNHHDSNKVENKLEWGIIVGDCDSN